MTRSDIYVLKGHIETERQKKISKIERHFARHMLAWGFGDFKGGEIFPWRNYPLRNCPRAKSPPPLYPDAPENAVPFLTWYKSETALPSTAGAHSAA